MRNVIIASGGIELLLVVAASLIAGPRAVSAIRALSARCVNVVIIGAVALVCWIGAGIAINRAVRLVPGDGQFITGPLRIGEIEFNLNVFVPMALISLGIAYLFAQAAVSAGRGRGLRESLGLRGDRASSAYGDLADGHEMPGAFMGASEIGAAVEDGDADLVIARR